MVQIFFSLFQWDCAGCSQVPEHHGNWLPSCLFVWRPTCSQQDSSQPRASRALFPLLPSPGLQSRGWAWGGSRAGTQPRTQPRQTVLRHPFPPPGAAPAHSPTNPPPQCPHPPVALDWCAVTIRLCLIHGWGLGRGFPRKERTPLGSCPVLARPQGTWPQPPWAWGWEEKLPMGLEDTVPAWAQPLFFNLQPWNVCGPISRVSEGSPRAPIILQ